MKEELITFDTAVLSKEKGFDYPTSNRYEHSLTEQEHHENGKSGPFGWEKGELNLTSSYMINNHKDVDYTNDSWYICSAPTQSLLQKWLRDIHNIFVSVDVNYNIKIYVNDELYDEIFTFHNYEGALEKGLQEALKLIKK